MESTKSEIYGRKYFTLHLKFSIIEVQSKNIDTSFAKCILGNVSKLSRLILSNASIRKNMEIYMNLTTILYNVANGIGTLTFNRPDVSNGFNVTMCNEILSVIEAAEADSNVRVLLINAVGKVFSVGGDLQEMKRAVEENDQQSLVEIAELVMKISFAMKRMPKPVVISTNGAVAGAAFNMVLAADLCIASTNSRFIQAFVNVGLAPDAGGMFLLTRSVGINRAMQLAMTGEAVPADKAKEYGFDVNDFDAIIVTDKGAYPIKKSDIIWLDSEVKYTEDGYIDKTSADFTVVGVKPALRSTKYVLKAVVK